MITKRMLGAALILAGIIVAVLALSVDLIGAGRWNGFGPVQTIGLSAGVFMALAGGILVRTNGRPA